MPKVVSSLHDWTVSTALSMWMHRPTIPKRLLLLVVLTLAPVLLLSVAVIQRLAQSQTLLKREQLNRETVSTRNALDGELRQFISIARILSVSPSLAAGDFTAFRREAERAVQDLNGVWVLVSDPDGQQLFNVAIPSGEPLPRRAAEAIATQTRAFETKQPQISDAFYAAYAKIPIVTVEAPVFRNGEPLYAVALVIDVRHFLPLLAVADLPPGWLAGIIDRRGNFIARSRDHDQRVLQPASEGWRRIRTQEGTFEFRSLDGELIAVGNAVSHLSGWAVSVAAAKDVLDAPVRRSVTEIAAAGAALLVLSLGLGVWIARGIVKPIKVLESAPTLEQVSSTGLPEIDRAIEARAVAERKLTAAIRSAAMGIHVWNVETGKLDWDDRVRELWGVDREATPTYETFASAIHPDDRPFVEDMVQRALDPKRDGAYLAEFRVRPLDGSPERWIRATGQVVLEAGAPKELIGTVRDITERKKYEERLQLLTGELAHRSKNLLAVVRSIASQILTDGEKKEAFIGRLQSLSRAYSGLAESSWDGVDLATLVRDELAMFSERVDISGPHVKLRAQAAQMFVLAVHELATNAAKYGALSRPKGRVSVRWSVGEDRIFSFRWIECGGPPVTPPKRKGFGSKLTDQALALEFGTTPEHEYHPEGVRYSFKTALQKLTGLATDAAPEEDLDDRERKAAPATTN